MRILYIIKLSSARYRVTKMMAKRRNDIGLIEEAKLFAERISTRMG